MKFEYNKEKFADLGLIVKRGNIGNMVFFWEEQNDAVIYNLEIYRVPEDYETKLYVEGFIKEAKISSLTNDLQEVLGHPYANRNSNCVTTKAPGFVNGKIVFNCFGDYSNWRYNHCNTMEFELAAIKPICAITVERNKFYHSINDLPCGDYIVCLKVENRNGEIFAESVPFYFHIEDAEKRADDRANGIARAAAPNIVGSNVNGNW